MFVAICVQFLCVYFQSIELMMLIRVHQQLAAVEGTLTWYSSRKELGRTLFEV